MRNNYLSKEKDKKYNIYMNFNLKSNIVYEDDNLLIVNKPRGLLLQQDGDINHDSLDKIVYPHSFSCVKERKYGDKNIVILQKI